MRRYRGLTLADHQRIGEQLYAARLALMKVGIEISNAFPRSHPASKAANKPHEAIDSLRVILDPLVCRMPGGCTRVYFPGPGYPECYRQWERERQGIE